VQCDELADRAAAKVWMRERGIPAKDLEWTALIKARSILQAVVRAVLACDTLRISSPGRLRPCANTDWRKFLIDHTPDHPRTSARVFTGAM